MLQDDQTAQLQEELAALKRQMRQMLEIVALVQSQQSGTRSMDPGGIPGAPRAAVEPSPAAYPTAALPAATPGSGVALPADSPALGASLLDENRRLQEIVRIQAEELGSLRERLARFGTDEPDGSGASQALAALVRALRGTP